MTSEMSMEADIGNICQAWGIPSWMPSRFKGWAKLANAVEEVSKTLADDLRKGGIKDTAESDRGVSAAVDLALQSFSKVRGFSDVDMTPSEEADLRNHLRDYMIRNVVMSYGESLGHGGIQAMLSRQAEAVEAVERYKIAIRDYITRHARSANISERHLSERGLFQLIRNDDDLSERQKGNLLSTYVKSLLNAMGCDYIEDLRGTPMFFGKPGQKKTEIVLDAVAAKLSLENANLRELAFIHKDLSDANMSGADLTGALFQECGLRGINVTKATVDNVSFFGSDLTGADLSNPKSFKDNDLRQIDATKAFFNGTHIVNGDMRGARFFMTQFKGAKVIHDYAGTFVPERQAEEARFVYCDYERSDLPDMVPEAKGDMRRNWMFRKAAAGIGAAALTGAAVYFGITQYGPVITASIEALKSSPALIDVLGHWPVAAAAIAAKFGIDGIIKGVKSFVEKGTVSIFGDA